MVRLRAKCAALVVGIQCYNIHDIPTTFSKASNLFESNLFGYAVSAHRYSSGDAKIFVGAPKNGAVGSVFECDFATHNCQDKLIVSTDSAKPSDHNDGGLLGASIHHDESGNGIFCQPGYGERWHCENTCLCSSQSCKSEYDRKMLFGPSQRIEDEKWGFIKRDGRCFYENARGRMDEWKFCPNWKVPSYSCTGGFGDVLFQRNNVLVAQLGDVNQQGSIVSIRNRDGKEDSKTNNFDASDKERYNNISDTFETCKDKCLEQHRGKRDRADCIKVCKRAKDDATRNYLSETFDLNHAGTSMASIMPAEDLTLVLVGIPHRQRNTLVGAVVAYPFYNGNFVEKDEIWNFTSEAFNGDDVGQMGEQFGHKVVSGDFDGDGVEDFAVSAPTWSNRKVGSMKINTGRVYVFRGTRAPPRSEKNEEKETDHFFSMSADFSETSGTVSVRDDYEPMQILEGVSEGAQFGFSMVAVDINEDGTDDLIISAPFDTDGGYIFVYNGRERRNGLPFDEEPSQVLSSSESEWFGHSLSVRADMDGNLYTDIAVGAPKSEELFLFRTRPSIQLDISVTLPKEPLRFDTTSNPFPCSKKAKAAGYTVCVQWRACATYSGKGLKNNLQGNIVVDLDSKLEDKRLFHFNKNGLQSHIQIPIDLVKEDISKCTAEYELVVKYSPAMNRVTPITVKSTVNVDIEDDELIPIVNPYSTVMDETDLTLWRDCGNDNICDVDFEMKTSSKVEVDVKRQTVSKGKLSVDEYNTITLNGTINMGPELSYGTHLFLEMPKTSTLSVVTINGESRDCADPGSKEKNLLTCQLGNPLQPMTHEVLVKLKIKPDGMATNEKFTMQIKNTNTQPAETELHKFNFRNKIEKDFKLSAMSLTGDKIEYDDSKGIPDGHLDLNQRFTVTNTGPTKVKRAKIVASFPKYTRGGKELLTTPRGVKAKYSKDGSEVSCKVLDPDHVFLPEEDEKITTSLGEHGERRYTCDEAAQCIQIECDLGSTDKPFAPKTSYSMVIESVLVKDTIDLFKNNSVITTSLQFKVERDGYNYNIRANEVVSLERTSQVRLTIKSLAQKEIPIWIIIAAAAGALLLLILIALVCWKCGVFSGNTDEETGMEEHTASVKMAEKPIVHRAHVDNNQQSY